jgi:cell division septation protein DedD
MLVICIPALLSYSRDIRNELSLSYGIPQEPQPTLTSQSPQSPQSIKSIHVDRPDYHASSIYWIKSQSFYSQPQAMMMLNRIRQLNIPAFLVQDPKQITHYYLGTGPFNTQNEATDTLNILYQKHIEQGMIMNQIPDLETLVF